jgi:cell division protein FtsI/penicillin-binding protein 2
LTGGPRPGRNEEGGEGSKIKKRLSSFFTRENTVIVGFASFLILAFVALGARCFYLQRTKGDYYDAQCLRQQVSYVPQEAQRGTILDGRGRVLAASNQIRNIFVDPREIKEPKEVASQLGAILDMPAHEICGSILKTRTPGYVLVKENATDAECDAARELPGVGVEYGWQRHYPTGQVTGHVVGFANRYNEGLQGIEYEFNKQLQGKGSRHAFMVDVQRRPLAFSIGKSQSDNDMPINGAGIILTLDATIQQFTREALMKQYKNYEAEGALAIVAEPQTGAILAMVSLPDFDPAQSSTADARSLYNRVMTDQFEPGSIIKPVAVAIGLDTGRIKTNDVFFCENGHYHDKGIGTISEYKEGFGNLDVRGILMHSSNIGMAKIGQRIGSDRLYEGLTVFGFGRKTGLELPGEASGLLRPAAEWTGYSVTRIPFGQEISVTALQMVRAFCVLANGGRAIRLHLVNGMIQPDGSMTDMRPPALRVGYVIRPDVAKWVVNDALVAVIQEGTGKKAQLKNWQVFGKTGTAQLARSDGRGYEEHAYIASFLGGAPVENPRVVVMVSFRRPNPKKGGYTGGVVAAPVAGEILEKTLTYLQVNDGLGDRTSSLVVKH